MMRLTVDFNSLTAVGLLKVALLPAEKAALRRHAMVELFDPLENQTVLGFVEQIADETALFDVDWTQLDEAQFAPSSAGLSVRTGDVVLGHVRVSEENVRHMAVPA